MIIKKASKIGFCSGVKRAFDKTIELSKTNKNLYLYGDLVHNKDVINYLKNHNIKILYNLNNLPQDANNSFVIIRAHGVTKKEKEVLYNYFLEVIDMTCPIVDNLINKALEFQKSGYHILVYGKQEHPEMVCLKGNIDESKLTINNNIVILSSKKICIFSQTTSSFFEFKDYCIKYIKNNEFSDIIIKNTICKETLIREKETEEISIWADLVVIIGGKHSSNTNKLYNIAKLNNNNVLYIENSSELSNEHLEKIEKIGIISGTSTPYWVIKEIEEKIKTNFS